MGSESDREVMAAASEQLESWGISHDVRVISAHRSPDLAARFSKGAVDRGIEVIIAAAGKAAHLAGVIAAHTPLPVIGVPIGSKDVGGVDSLLATVQMPSGVPVATVAVNGSRNAAILAAQIIAVGDPRLRSELQAFKEEMARKLEEKSGQGI